MVETFPTSGSGYLTGQLLAAMPGMPDPRFAKTVVYMCSHSSEGAMGIVINRIMDNITFPELLSQLDIDAAGVSDDLDIRLGGPVETGRGFVLHSSDYTQDSTMAVDDQISLTATVDILRAIADGRGPRQHVLALGYAGWGPGQLDQEILDNGWLSAPASQSILFDDDLDTKWERAMGAVGIDPRLLVDNAGHA